MAFAEVCQDNLMYYMGVAFYLNMTWFLNKAVQGLSSFINPETRLKMQFSDENTTQGLRELFHPCQLEKRFGGSCETPTNFWPPHVGKQFVPDGQEQPMKFMEEEEYKRALQENPELPWHPDFMTSPDCPNRDFTYQEAQNPIDFSDKRGDTKSSYQSFYSVNTHEVGLTGSHRSKFMSSMRLGSVYLDAYVGDEEQDYQTKLVNQNTVGKVP